MHYIPVIKLKYYELLRSKYIKDYLGHPNIMPFFELRYSLEEDGKNKNINDFIAKTNVNRFFLGIPHKPSIIQAGKGKTGNFIVDANQSPRKYYEETVNLFTLENAVPVFYVYRESDKTLVNSFIKYGHDLKRRVAIITTPRIAKEMCITSLTESDYLFIDLEQQSIMSQAFANLKPITDTYKAKIILIRENRSQSTYNSSFVSEEPAPLKLDLSTEFDGLLSDKVKIRIDGFGDYCGNKNDISTDDQPIDSSDFYPAVALYQREENPIIFLGVKTSLKIKEGGFQDLKNITLSLIDRLDRDRRTPLLDILNNEPTKNYATWNVITEWFYLAKMAINDDWKKYVIRGI